MVWAHAKRVAASLSDSFSWWRSCAKLPGNNVRRFWFAAVFAGGLRVTPVVHCALPQPTGLGLFHIRPESLLIPHDSSVSQLG